MPAYSRTHCCDAAGPVLRGTPGSIHSLGDWFALEVEMFRGKLARDGKCSAMPGYQLPAVGPGPIRSLFCRRQQQSLMILWLSQLNEPDMQV
jgi:hypothetical protein